MLSDLGSNRFQCSEKSLTSKYQNVAEFREGKKMPFCLTTMLPYATKFKQYSKDMIHFFLNAKQWFDDNYMGKQPVAWSEHCAVSSSKTNSRKEWITALNTIESNSQSIIKLKKKQIVNLNNM